MYEKALRDLEQRVAKLEEERDKLLKATPPLLPSNTPDMPYTVGWNDCVRWIQHMRNN